LSVATSTPAERLSLLSREELETLVQLSQAFNSTIDLDSLLPRILGRTLSATDSEAGSIWIVEGDHLVCTHVAGAAASGLRGLRQPLSEGVLGEAVRTGSTVVTGNALTHESFRAYRENGSGFRTRSAVTIPLVLGEPLGAIELVNDVGGKDEFSDEDIAFLECLADDAAAALRNARLFEAERRARSLRALLDVSHEITSTFDLDRILLSIVNLADRAVRFERCVIAVRARDELRVQAISGEEQVDGKSASVKELERVLLWSAEHQGVLFINDVEADLAEARALRERFSSYITSSEARGLLVVPIADAEGELGRLLFEFSEPNVLDERMREATGILANQAALAMRNAQLYADVPFISWLEPIAQKRRALMALPAATLLKYAAGVLVTLALLILVRMPLRVAASSAVVHAGVQLPARAGAEGVIEAMLVREGDRVTAGQPIARLRNEQLLARLSETQGALRLSERQSLAAGAVGNASAAAAARVNVEQYRNALGLLDREAQSLVVKAPAAGIVLTPQLAERVGSFRLAGEPVAWIGDPDRVEVRLLVPQHEIAYVRENDRVRIRASALPEVRFEGAVTGVAPLAETFAGAPHYMVRAILDNPLHQLRPGMEARARVLTQSRPLGYLIVRRPWRWVRLHLWW
jgi:GAF domain-containing protein/multidrug resistance efflux pump